MEKLNTAFYDVFKQRLKIQKDKLKEELERAKSDRRKEFIRSEIKECKSMRDLLKDMEKQMGKLEHCPHCGHKL